MMSVSFCANAWNINDFGREISSPMTQESARNVFIVGASTTFITNYFLRDSIVYPLRKTMTKSNRLGDADEPIELAGRDVPNGIYFLSMLGLGYFGEKDSDDQKRYYENAEVMFKATTYAALVTTILKYTIREKRPNGPNRNSFPSGHTTTAFAFASVVGARHPLYYGIPAYALAALVGVQRMNSDSHYLQDVLAGATVGTAFGLGINSLYDKSSENKNITFSMIPISHNGFFASGRYSF